MNTTAHETASKRTGTYILLAGGVGAAAGAALGYFLVGMALLPSGAIIGALAGIISGGVRSIRVPDKLLPILVAGGAGGIATALLWCALSMQPLVALLPFLAFPLRPAGNAYMTPQPIALPTHQRHR